MRRFIAEQTGGTRSQEEKKKHATVAFMRNQWRWKISDGQVPRDGERAPYQTGIRDSIKRQDSLRGGNISVIKRGRRPTETGITDQRSL